MIKKSLSNSIGLRNFACGVALLCLLLVPFRAKTQTLISKEPPEIIAVFDAMYRYDFPDAEKKLKLLNSTTISQDWIDLAHVNLLWWWLISGDESRDYDNLMAVVLNRVINRLTVTEELQLKREQVFTLIHCYAYLTRVDIYQERYFKGIVNLNHTLGYLKTALKDAESYDKFLMVSGLYNYFAAVTLDNYPVFTPFFAFAPKSDRELGFDQLTRCSRMENLLIRNESLYYLMKINYQLEENYGKALAISDQLISQYPNNLIYHFHRLMILIDAGRTTESVEQFSKLCKVSEQAPALNSLQRQHLVDIARKKLKKKKINPAI